MGCAAEPQPSFEQRGFFGFLVPDLGVDVLDVVAEDAAVGTSF